MLQALRDSEAIRVFVIVNYTLFVFIGVLGLASAVLAFKSKSEAIRKFIGPPHYMIAFGTILVCTGIGGLFHKSVPEPLSTAFNLLMILALLFYIVRVKRSA